MLPINRDGCSSLCDQQHQRQKQPRSGLQSCCDLNEENGRTSTESETFLILGQFEKLYKNRLAEVEAGADVTNAQVTELKLKIMADWVEDLGEQNKMLVKTVHELEQAAICRVKLLENKLQETSTLISHNVSHSSKSEEDLNALSNRTNILLNDQNDMQQKIDYLQNDVSNLLKLIKRGREENNWDLDGINFCLIQPSDIPTPPNCSCYQITSESNNEESTLVEKLREELRITKAEMNKLKDEHKCEINNLLFNIDEKYCEIEKLLARLACLDKENTVTEVNQDCLCLIEELKEKKIIICNLKEIIATHEKTIKNLSENYRIKNSIICELKNRLKNELKKNDEKDSTASKNIKINIERYRKERIKYQLLENTTEDLLRISTEKQLEELKSLLVLKDTEINKLKTVLNEKSNHAQYETDGSVSYKDSIENLNPTPSMNAVDLISKDDILSLKTENETILEQLRNVENIHKLEIAIANEKLKDVKDTICNFRSDVEKNQYRDIIIEFITTTENKIICIQNMFQNKREMCVKENLPSEINEIISKLTSGNHTLSKIYENKNEAASTIENKPGKSDAIYKKTVSEYEEKAIFDAILQQFRMMEEFRICTVEVQAATEDLREEMSLVISNLNTRHSKYIELTKMVSQVQDCLTRTRGNILEVMNRLELQDEERVRHNERITNNRIRLKGIKNEFNQTQSELSKCLNNVHSNIQQTNLLGYAEIHICNNLLITLVEEVERVVSNLHNFQTQGSCTYSTMTELIKQLTVTELSIKELKQKSDQVLIENEAAQKYFAEKSKRLEKYEYEIDNCHTKMQDVLESIIAIRNQMNKFGCLKEMEDSFQTTNEIIKLKDELRRIQKECEQFKFKTVKESLTDKEDEVELIWENSAIELQDEVKLLKTEIKCKQEANIFLKQNILSLEKELNSVLAKAEDYRKCSSTESLELKKTIIEFENCLRVQKDTENNLKCLVNDDIDSKKLQSFDYVNKDQFFDGTIHGLQGVHENMIQLLKTLQDTTQAIKSGLQELGDEFKRLISEDTSHSCSSISSIQTAVEILSKYIDRIKYCSSEVEKIKITLCSKHKIIENIDEIIRIQKDSILISQSEMENLHKTFHDKIEIQEKEIYQCEQEKRQLIKKVEFQVQTISHLQDAVLKAKRTIDELNKKAASDNDNKSQIIRSLNLYLTETEIQYNDCFGEASKQSALLELQRDAISTLQKKINFLECDEFLNTFMLHFIYYVVLFKYQKELESQNLKITDMKLKMSELSNTNNCLEKQCSSIQCKYEEKTNEMEKLKSDFEDSRKKLFCEKKREIDALVIENNDVKNQLQVYKLDLDLIQEEMEKIGLTKPFIQNFKIELETLRSENKHFRCDTENYKKMITELENNNECLKKEISNLEQINTENYNEINHHLQNERVNFTNNDTYIAEELKDENKILKKKNDILKAQMDVFEEKSKNDIYILKQQLDVTKCQLLESQQNYEKVLQDLNKNLINAQTLINQENCNCNESSKKKETKKSEGIEKKFTKDREDFKERFEKCESYGRIYQRQKDEIMLLKKKLVCANQQLLNCNVTKEEMIRQNKLLEENNNKSMVELEDIVVQLDDMQNSLARLKSQCDAKTQSLECVSIELAKMKRSRAEGCEESKYILNWVRVWIRQQKNMISALQDKLCEKQQQLLCISSEKKKLLITMKRLIRENKILTKGLKFTRRQTANKQSGGLQCFSSLREIHSSSFKDKDNLSNGFYSPHLNNKQSNAVYTHFKRECREKPNCTENKIRIQGDYKLFSTLEYFSEKLPITSQINENIQIEKRTHEDRSDYGYQTSSSK